MRRRHRVFQSVWTVGGFGTPAHDGCRDRFPAVGQRLLSSRTLLGRHHNRDRHAVDAWRCLERVTATALRNRVGWTYRGGNNRLSRARNAGFCIGHARDGAGLRVSPIGRQRLSIRGRNPRHHHASRAARTHLARRGAQVCRGFLRHCSGNGRLRIVERRKITRLHASCTVRVARRGTLFESPVRPSSRTGSKSQTSRNTPPHAA